MDQPRMRERSSESNTESECAEGHAPKSGFASLFQNKKKQQKNLFFWSLHSNNKMRSPLCWGNGGKESKVRPTGRYSTINSIRLVYFIPSQLLGPGAFKMNLHCILINSNTQWLVNVSLIWRTIAASFSMKTIDKNWLYAKSCHRLFFILKFNEKILNFRMIINMDKNLTLYRYFVKV